MKKTAKISEIFSSLQGEGLYIGVPQVFVRFYGCNLKCAFCDTALESYKEFTRDALIEKISQYKMPYHSISLTGGEPLLQADFIKDFLETRKSEKKPIYLETNGTLHEEFLGIIEHVDIIAMDFKLPSSAGVGAFWEEHGRFLKAASKKEVFVKAVVSSQTISGDIIRMREIVERIDRNIPVVLQPVTALDNIDEASSENLDLFRNILKESIVYVKVISQVHKLIGVK